MERIPQLSLKISRILGFPMRLKKGMRFGNYGDWIKEWYEINYFSTRLLFGILCWQLFGGRRYFQSWNGVGHYTRGWIYCAGHFYHR